MNRFQTGAVLALAALLGACPDNDSKAPGGQLTSRSAQAPATLQGTQVNSTEDAVDANPGDGRCATDSGLCTLRAAIMEANASGFDENGDRFTILLPAGEYKLTIPNPVSTADLGIEQVPGRPLTSLDSAGSLLLSVPMTIRGAGARATTVDASQLDRTIEVDVGADSTISDLTITGGANNTLGGGVYGQARTRLERVHVTGNEASGGGGIFINPLGALELIDSTVSHNTAAYQAGGIRIDSRGLIVNSTISHNRANGPVSPLPGGAGPAPLIGKGGGVDIRGLDVFILNSTIVNNSADAGGAGIHFALAYLDSLPLPLTDPVTETLAALYLANTIVAGNEGPSQCLHVASSRFFSLGNNIDSDGSCGLDAPGDLPLTDPLLGPLADNGGATDTHAPQRGSPAIDAGLAGQCPTSDQRGQRRPRGRRCDIGAVESR